LIGQEIERLDLNQVAEIALSGAQPLRKNAYKLPLAKALVRRALETLAEECN
jgi:CO/xanthine dehydrogenase FAD-binding subunit